MWLQLQLHHSPRTRINIHTETFRNCWGEDPSSLPCTNTAYEVYTSCTAFLTHLAGYHWVLENPTASLSLSLPPRAHSKNNHTIIHFKPFLLKLLHNWTKMQPWCNMHQNEDEWRACSKAFRIYARLLSVVASDMLDKYGHRVMQGCSCSIPLSLYTMSSIYP